MKKINTDTPIEAKQQFFSRVPAKVSIVNRADGYDSFAASEGIRREFLEKELNPLCQIKLTKEEEALVREGKLPPIYLQYGTKSGSFVKTKITFMPLDYTGERVSYMAHSLVFDKDSADSMLAIENAAMFNDERFKSDLSEFEFTSFDAKPIRKYPTLSYAQQEAPDCFEVLRMYDKDMLKRLIYSVLCATCSKGKPIYFSVCQGAKQTSEVSRRFMDALMQIFPYFIKSKISFVSYTNDVVKFPSIKIKAVSEELTDFPTTKGILLNMRHRLVFGLRDEIVRDEAFLVDFFYAMIQNAELRHDFIAFCEGAVEKNPAFEDIQIKTLRELAIIFCNCSGYYDEKVILPNDDAIYKYISAYEKFREFIPDSFRKNATVFLKRYCKEHSQIPPKIFGKIVKLYSTETQDSRDTMRSILLELFHTDAMRDKLFNFFKACYPTENEENKNIIIENICRVYYGGFLRSQILDFFSEIYDNEKPEIKDMIFEKILLTARTEAIKDKLIEFIVFHYPSCTKKQKEKLIITYVEILAVADYLAKDLSEKLLPLIENDEDTSFKALFLEKVFEAIEAEQRHRGQTMLAFLVENKYSYLERAVASKIFTEWTDRVILRQYILLAMKSGIPYAVNNLISEYKITENITSETDGKILTYLIEAASELKDRDDVIALMQSDTDALEFVKERPEKREFFSAICKEIIRPRIYASIDSIFKRSGGIDAFITYGTVNSEIKNLPQYKAVSLLGGMEKSLRERNIPKFLEICAQIEDASLLKAILSIFDEPKSLPAASYASYALFLNYTSQRQPNFTDLFDEVRSIIVEANIGTEYASEPEFDTESKCITAILQAVNEFIKHFHGEYSDNMLSIDSSLNDVKNSFINHHKKKAQKALNTLCTEQKGFEKALCDFVRGNDNQSKGLFGKLFGKK